MSDNRQKQQRNQNKQKENRYLLFLVSIFAFFIAATLSVFFVQYNKKKHVKPSISVIKLLKSSFETRNPISSQSPMTTDNSVYKFPPATLGPSIQPIDGVKYGTGVYVISSSSTNKTITNLLYKVADGNYYYGSAGSGATINYNDYSTTDGYYTGSVTTSDVDKNNYNGEWIQISLPLAIYLKNFVIYVLWTGSQPYNVVLLGSNDGTNWTKLLMSSSLKYSQSTIPSTNYKTILNVDATVAYSFYRLVALRCGDVYTDGTYYGHGGFTISELEFYGTLI